MQRDTPMEIALKGAAAGLAGTAVLTLAMAAAERFFGLSASQDTIDSEPGAEPTEPPARFVGKLAAGVFEYELPTELQSALGHGIHWSYGALWGLIYGIVQSSVRLPLTLHGALLGLIVWLIGPRGLIPAMKLVPPSPAMPSPYPIRSLIFHQVYGWAVALAFALLCRSR